MCNGCVPRSSKQSNLISLDSSAFRIPAHWDGVWIVAVHLFKSGASPKEWRHSILLIKPQECRQVIFLRISFSIVICHPCPVAASSYTQWTSTSPQNPFQVWELRDPASPWLSAFPSYLCSACSQFSLGLVFYEVRTWPCCQHMCCRHRWRQT